MTAQYTVLISMEPPKLRTRLWAWVSRCPSRARPRATQWWPPCPVCQASVRTWEPLIRQGDEFYDANWSWKSPDTVKGFRLQPCGHEVPSAGWARATRGVMP